MNCLICYKEKLLNKIASITRSKKRYEIIVDQCLILMEKEHISKEEALKSLNISFTPKERQKLLDKIQHKIWN